MGNKEYSFSSTSQKNTETKSLCSLGSSLQNASIECLVFLQNPVRTSPPSSARSLRALLHCRKKITPVSTMMPVFSVNLSWQHPALTPVTRRSNQTFPLQSSSPRLIGCFQSVTELRHRKSTDWLGSSQRKQPWSWQLCVQTQYALLVCCLISFSLSVSPACSLRPETVFSSQCLKATQAGRTQ